MMDAMLSQIIQDDANVFFAEVRETFARLVAEGFTPSVQYAPVVVRDTIVYTAFITAPKKGDE